MMENIFALRCRASRTRLMKSRKRCIGCVSRSFCPGCTRRSRSGRTRGFTCRCPAPPAAAAAAAAAPSGRRSKLGTLPLQEQQQQQEQLQQPKQRPHPIAAAAVAAAGVLLLKAVYFQFFRCGENIFHHARVCMYAVCINATADVLLVGMCIYSILYRHNTVYILTN